jgi:hypothetical protein
MAKLDPQLISLLMQQPAFNAGGYGLERTYTDPVTGQVYTAQANYATNDRGDQAGQLVPWTIHQQTGANKTNAFDEQGDYIGQQSGMSEDAMLAMMALAVAGGAYAGGAFGGAAPAAATAGEAALPAGMSAGSSITLPTMAELGIAPATAEGLLGTMPAVNMAGATAGGLAGSTLGTTGVNPMRAGEIAGYSTNGALPSSAAVTAGTTGAGLLNGMDAGKALATLAGTAAGVAGSKDQQQSTSRDPWGPAQPFLQSLLDQGQQLQQQYRDQPFSDAQKTAYNNWGGLLNAANQGSIGLLQGMQANAGGQNAYDRLNPRKALTGSSPQFSWNPGLLNFFPKG